MNEKTEGKDTKKKVEWKPDENLTMVIKKGADWKPDERLTMKLQEGTPKKKEKDTQE
jgi:hypothetical protein